MKEVIRNKRRRKKHVKRREVIRFVGKGEREKGRDGEGGERKEEETER